MPRKGAYLPITDSRTNKSYMYPISDVTKMPTEQDIESFIYDQENPSTFSKLTGLVTKPLANLGKPLDDIGESLMQYSEGQPLRMFGREQSPARNWNKEGMIGNIDRVVSKYGGAFLQSLGEQANSLSSPAGIALMAAGPVGKGLQATGLPAVARAGTALTYAPKVMGGVQAAHGAKGMLDVTMDPNAGWSDYANPLLDVGLGTVGMLAPRAQYKPKAIAQDTIPSLTTGDLPKWGPVLQRGVDPSSVPSRWDVPAGPSRPSIGDWLREGPGEQPVRPGTTEVPLPRWDVPQEPVARGTGYTTIDTPNYAGIEPPYIQEIKQRFDAAMGGRTRPPMGVNSEPAPHPSEIIRQQDMRRVQAGQDRMASLQADINAENAAAGFKVTSRPPKSVPDVATIEAEGLRRPYSENRAKYPKAVLDAIDKETLANPSVAADITPGELADIAKRMGVDSPVSEVSDAPPRQSWKGARFKGTGKREGWRSQRGEVTLSPLEPLGEKLGEGIDWLYSAPGKVKAGASALRSKALQNIADAEATGVFGPATKAVGKARLAASALTGKDVTNASVRGLTRSGWQHLETMGEPGKRLARLIKRERIDTGIEKAAATKEGKFLVDEKGKPINEIGGLIYKRNKEHIEQLISQIEDPNQQSQARAIIQKYAGHGANLEKPFASGYNSIKQLEALSKLSQFSVSNVAGLGTTAMRNKLGSVLKATHRVMRDFESAFNEAKESGMLDKIDSAMRADTGEGGLSKIADKMFGITASEHRIRTISTLAGKETAADLFAEIKANPKLRNNKFKMKQLDDLLLEDDYDSVFKQDKLTPQQLRRAGGRMNELTQGTAESIDLPPQWTGHPIMDLLTQFKKYGYMQSRNMMEAFKANPVRTVATLATVFPALGEAIGDTKAGIKGAAKGIAGDKDVMKAMADEVAGRGSGATRYFTNMGQAWAFGLLDDLRRGAERGPAGLATSLAGPFVDDLSEAAYGANEAIRKGQTYHLQRQAARTVPYVGTALAGTIKGSYAGRQGRRSRPKRNR